MAGTKKHCPFCKGITKCKVLPSKSAKNFHMIDNRDLIFFERYLECQTCKNEFRTSEIDHKFLIELEDLRKEVKELKENDEETVEGLRKTITSLQRQKGGLINKLNTLESFKQKFLEIQQALKVIKKYG